MGQLESAADEMPGLDVVAVEAVLLGPSVKQQIGVTGSKERAVALQQLLLGKALDDPRQSAGVEVGAVAESFWRHHRSGSSRRVRATRELLGANADVPVWILTSAVSSP